MKIRRHLTVVRKGWRCTDGQAQVEFLFVVIFLVVLSLIFVEMVSLIHTYNVLADAAKEGVRYAVVHGSRNSQESKPGSTTDIDGPAAPTGTLGGYGSGYGVVKTYAKYALHDMSGVTVSVSYLDTANPPANQAPNRVRVVVSYPYSPFFFSWPSVTVNAAAEGRIMN